MNESDYKKVEDSFKEDYSGRRTEYSRKVSTSEALRKRVLNYLSGTNGNGQH